jgi:hypothetical protein
MAAVSQVVIADIAAAAPALRPLYSRKSLLYAAADDVEEQI